MYKDPYAKYLLGDQGEQRPSKKKFPEWDKWKNNGVKVNKRTGAAGREEKNMPTIGEEFGFSIFSRNRETNHREQDSQ